MKKLSIILGLGLQALFGIPSAVSAQSQPAAQNSAVVTKSLLLSVGYVNEDNRLQSLKAVAKTKVNGKFSFVGDVALRFYIKTDSPRYLMGTAVTNEKGEAFVYFPPDVCDEWRASSKQHFIVVADPGMGFPATETEADVTKARLSIDTAEGRSVVVRLTELRGGGWMPVKGVDVKVAVRRTGGDLNIGDAATYSTDSTGACSAPFKLDSLPGDQHGDLLLVASVDDNDTYGTLSVEKHVRWGVSRPWASAYDLRTLFARRGRSPFWLEGMAYSIIVFVWGTLVFLLLQIVRLKRLGKA